MSFNTEFQYLIQEIQTLGQESTPRDLKVKELNLGLMELNPTNVFADFEARKFNFKYFAGELAWYLNRDRDVSYIGKFSNFWQNITNPGTNEINSNYGSLLFGEQLRWVYESLARDKNTRQAIAFLNQPKFQFPGNKDFVCTMYLNFWIRDNKLNMKVQMRSNDIFYGLTYDAPFFAFVQQHVWLWLQESSYPDLELGTYYHSADNIHYYEQHFKLADAIMAEDTSSRQTYIMNLKQPLFKIDADNQFILTEAGQEYINQVNALVDAKAEASQYYSLISKYMLEECTLTTTF